MKSKNQNDKPGLVAPQGPHAIEDHTDDETIVASIQTIEPVMVAETPALLVIAGPHMGRSHVIDKAEFTIGRVETCDLVVDDDLVSRTHCKFLTKGGVTVLKDLGSTNGTLLNGRRVDEAELKEGDQIQVGASTIFRFHLQEEVERKFFEELFKAATKDFLTNTYNKKYFLDRLQAEFAYTHRHGGDLSVIVLDIDHFKKVNDTYGHLAGDIALQKMAHYLLTHTRKDDLVARFGGEEFVILMRDCELEPARSLAENLRQGISQMQIKTNQHEFRITISMGIACLTEKNKGNYVRFEHLIEHADTQLYKAKTSGRNRVCA